VCATAKGAGRCSAVRSQDYVGNGLHDRVASPPAAAAVVSHVDDQRRFRRNPYAAVLPPNLAGLSARLARRPERTSADPMAVEVRDEELVGACRRRRSAQCDGA
jgi:hypothetical protein